MLGIAGSLALGTVGPAAAADPPPSWPADLPAGEAAGIAFDGTAARLDPRTAFPAATEGGADERAAPETTVRPTGLLTFPARRLEHATNRVVAAVDADVPPGATATVDVRTRRSSGGWTEWVPAATDGTERVVALPVAGTEVQGRLVLAGDPAAGPVVRSVTLTAHPAPPGHTEGEEAAEALSYRVFATREGLVGGTTANGHVIRPRDHFAALPSRRALSPRGSSDYTVKVCARTGRCAFAPVWDVGPWNTRDDYWNPPSRRQEWRDLPRGVPQAQAAHQDGYNGGRDQYGRRVANPSGIDLGDGLFWDALGLKDNAWVTVDYLWTGTERLSRVDVDTDVLAAPDAAAEVVGVAVEHAAVPVTCVLEDGDDRWLRIGTDQYLEASAVPDLEQAVACGRP
ncbi:hypothetical protein CFP66_19765 [Pseudonocardia sp. MH-G8]|nr:hypothetical protein CFP66_19765 [Pseudonocardia sp. MH-G8]